MKNKLFLLGGLLTGFLSFAQNIDDRESNTEFNQGIKIGNLVEMSGDWFIAYQNRTQEKPGKEAENFNGFILKRSYFTLKKDLTDVFSVRYTMDLTVDKEGNDRGNIETRLKYLYLKVKPKINSDIFTGTWIEVGMVHTPWLDYEQAINTYRVQDNMFIERNGIFNSADFGVTFGGNIGPKMDKEFIKEHGKSMNGKYVSYDFGIHNGGGYSAIEDNASKVISGRISTRPFANKIPEFQISSGFRIGKGNIKEEPDFKQILGFAAYTGKQLTLTGQYHTGTGDFKGKYVDPNDKQKALDNRGYSFFGEYKVPNTNFALWSRYDYFEVDKINMEVNRYIGGLSYRVNEYLRLILDTEYHTINEEKDYIYELNMEINF
ncbi:hypothetical protein KRX57_09430 [Weeksellaceae bacterium TAE3-ERU29]|nr:hypothetical protein [Weeksellaceae bacterium TAE3-ERU29]